MRRRNVLFWYVICTLTLVGSVSAWMVKVPLEDLVEQADNVLMGEVLDLRSSWDPDGQWIRTYVTISVDDVIKGTLGEGECVVSYIGGVVGEIGLWQSDTPVFEIGQEVFVFLQPDGRGTFRVTGRYQGKFTVERNEIVERDEMVDAFVRRVKTIMKNH